MFKSRAGFTLTEIIVVVGIIAVLVTVTYSNFNESTAQARDAQRQADLRNMQNAIELYKNKIGRYPAGCRGANQWSGQPGSGYDCDSATEDYIMGLAPDFIRVLPKDPKLNGNQSGYLYATNAAGSVYTIRARNTIESEESEVNLVERPKHPFRSCDVTAGSSSGICDAVSPSLIKSQSCEWTNAIFTHSYGLWGGFADEPRPSHASRYEEETERILCTLP